MARPSRIPTPKAGASPPTRAALNPDGAPPAAPRRRAAHARPRADIPAAPRRPRKTP